MIVITQTCDGCDACRTVSSVSNAENGGWRVVKPDKHLCSDCIKGILERAARSKNTS